VNEMLKNISYDACLLVYNNVKVEIYPRLIINDQKGAQKCPVSSPKFWVRHWHLNANCGDI